MFRFHISALPWLAKIWSSTSALSFCIDCQKCEVPLPHPHFRSAFTAKYVKFCSRASALPLLAPTAAVLCPWARHFTPRKYWLITQEAMAPSRYDWKIVDWDVKPQHNQPTNQPLLAKIWSSAFRTCSARTSKDVKFRFRISSLPGLPKICSFASALSLSLDCQRSEDRLLH